MFGTSVNAVDSDQIGTECCIGDLRFSSVGSLDSILLPSAGSDESPQLSKLPTDSPMQPWQLPLIDLDRSDIRPAARTKRLEGSCSKISLRETEPRSSVARPADLGLPKLAWEEASEAL